MEFVSLCLCGKMCRAVSHPPFQENIHEIRMFEEAVDCRRRRDFPIIGLHGPGGRHSGTNCRTGVAALKEGNERFATDRLEHKDMGAARRTELTAGQHPFAAVLSCADSRVPPEIVFDQGLGDLFVVRVAGNVGEPFALGSIDYAVEHLHVPLIVVLGHEKCGACGGLGR